MNVSRLRPCERCRLVDPFARVALNVGCGVNASPPPLLIANAKPSFIPACDGSSEVAPSIFAWYATSPFLYLTQ
jgi:hypothetical protein